MNTRFLSAASILPLIGLLLGAAAFADPQIKVTICHKFGTPAEGTLQVGYPAAVSHVQQHGDFWGACPQFDQFIDVDGIVTPGRGLPGGINVSVGKPLTPWPTGFYNEGLDWFDNDGSCTWTLGDDLHLEDGSGSCVTGIRNGFHEVGFDCVVLDLDASFFEGQLVDVDLETGTSFTGCLGPDPLLRFYDANGNGFYDNGEDIVLDANSNGVFD
jgi:hypothetical protein